MFVALGIQHAMRMLYPVICDLFGCTIFFSTLFHKRHDFRKKKVLHIKRLLCSPQRSTDTFLILRRTGRVMTKNVYWSSCKVPVILSGLKFKFLGIFSKNYQISNLIKIRPVGDKLFHADGRRDMTKLIAALCNSANARLKRMPLETFIILTNVRYNFLINSIYYSIILLY